MRRVGRGIMVAGVVAGLVLGVASAAAAKPRGVSTSKYAKTVCGVYSSLEDQLKSFATSIGNLDPTDPAGFQAQATSLTNTFIMTVKNDETTLMNVYPNISNGKKIGASLVANSTEVDQALSTALSKLDPSNPGASIDFTTSIATLGTSLSDPFSKITNQQLIGAFQKEPSCKSVVTVY
ncbi:MAG TPA: hypothetical protein VGU73_09775 [Acidimicrobiia bacterium]|nr:hypothetical protein [Acidimicrobiia bacterium]